MARYTGAVRFNDGALLFFVYNGMVDTARPKLFDSEAAAFDAWDEPQGREMYGGGDPLVDERVDVMPYFAHGGTDVAWTTTANRQAMRITGSLAAD